MVWVFFLCFFNLFYFKWKKLGKIAPENLLPYHPGPGGRSLHVPCVTAQPCWMSHAFDQLLRGSPVFPVPSVAWGGGAGTGREWGGGDAEVRRQCTFELQRSRGDTSNGTLLAQAVPRLFCLGGSCHGGGTCPNKCALVPESWQIIPGKSECCSSSLLAKNQPHTFSQKRDSSFQLRHF